MLNDFLRLSDIKTLEYIDQKLRQGTSLTAFGMQSSGKFHAVTLLNDKVTFVVKDTVAANFAYEQISLMTDKKVVLLPAVDDVLMVADGYLKSSVYKRINAINEIQKGADIVVAPVEALMQLYPSKVEEFTFVKGENYDRDEVVRALISLGYEREASAEKDGTFAVRGDVIDVVMPEKEKFARLDFFDDTLEEIKVFDLQTKKVLERITTFLVTDVTDCKFDESDQSLVLSKMNAELKKMPLSVRQKFSDTVDEWEEILRNKNYDKARFITPLLQNFKYGICQDFNGVIVLDEPQALYDYMQVYYKEFVGRHNQFYEDGKTFKFTENLVLDVEQFKAELNEKTTLSFCSAITSNPLAKPKEQVKLSVSSSASYRYVWKDFIADVKNYKNNGYKIIICGENRKNCETIGYELEKNDLSYKIFDEPNDSFDGIVLATVPLQSGFIYITDKIVVTSARDVMPYSEQTTKKKKKNAFFVAPEVGDYVVHETHGIGKIVNTRRILSANSTKDYLSIEYLNGTLYVPVENFDVLSKYIGEDNPPLSKIGGAAFDKVKERVRQSLAEMSFDLKKLYEERTAKSGYVFNDDYLQEYFDNAFLYDDTPDQATAALDVKKDMCSEKVMDRLICGDVGFGKTEIAFRAIFRCINNGKQAVLLAPTTILTEQHYRTAVKRFDGFGVKIGLLNRFKSKTEQEKILKELKDGSLQLVIGTHRLLSKDVKFKDLGLLVLDEEQRFGVEHKEKIKLLKANVDALTLTATPIPRTLNMSLSGIRDISTITTAPEGRLPVQTYVAEQTDALVADAINRELARGGQAFVLYNRVETIFTFAQKISSLVPNAKIVVAHGQMPADTLEKNIKTFYDGEKDVLVATTLIENGIDLPQANTLVVIDADRLGLSALYQLRGRVGRSDRLARAYFLYQKDKVLSANAYGRLSALIDFAEMGSGFKIAMRDLQIRGAGNVLGKEQHGHIAKIGYELYSKLLKEQLTGEKERTVEMNVDLTAYISERYVSKAVKRMELYKQITDVKGKKDYEETRTQLTEYYGKIPKETEMLLKIALAKAFAKKLGVKEVAINTEEAFIVLDSFDVLQDKKLQTVMDKHQKNLFLSFVEKPRIMFKHKKGENENTFEAMFNFLSDYANGN